jgi:hypothetical protein
LRVQPAAPGARRICQLEGEVTRTKVVGSLVAGVVQFGLAILVFGGWTVFFNHPARIALPIVTLGLMLVAPFSNVNLSSGEKEDRANRFCVVASVCAWFSGNLDRRKASRSLR